MKSTNQVGMWVASAWCLIIAIGLTFYLIRSLRRGSITFPARFASDFSRDENPGMFWFAATLYFVFDAFAIVCLLIRIYDIFKPAA
jgi:hypothetical protein